MTEIRVRRSAQESLDAVETGNPFPVSIEQNNAENASKLWVSPWVVANYGATSGAHDANDALGDKFTFSQSEDGRPLPMYGRILRLQCLDRADNALANSTHIFNDDFTAAASDAAFTISVLDAMKWVTSQTFGAYTDIGSAKVAEVNDVDADYYAPQNRLVCQDSTTGTPTVGANTMPMHRIFILPLG